MRSKIKSIIQQQLLAVRNLAAIVAIRCRKVSAADAGILVVSIKAFNHGRYGFLMLHFLQEAGYKVCLYNSNHFLLSLQGYNRQILESPDLCIISRAGILRLKNFSVLYVNSIEDPELFAKCRKTMRINFNYFQESAPGNCILKMPYTAHPLVIRYQQQKLYRYSKQQNGVFFYAHADNSENDFVKKKFNLYKRSEVYQYLKNSRVSKVEPSTYSELHEQRVFDPARFFLIDGDRFRIPTNEWLTVLSSFRFFIATPGMIMPQCHNLIEAISLGVIPILQSPATYLDHLTDGVDCIGFRELHELPDKISQAMMMTNEELEKMSANVRAYYEKYLSPVSLKQQIESSACSNIELLYNAEEISLL